jgi:prepilin-type N-terminal cleavage/methylation domain-containing protein
MEHRRKKLHRQSGFTLIEAMISIAVLSFGVLSLAAVYAQGIFYASLTQYDYIAEKKAEQAVESIFAARDTGTLVWSQIQNVSGVTGSDGGVFKDGAQPILVPGPDGLVGATTDAGAADELIIIGPGADHIFGTSDDETVDLNPWMTRTIVIAPVPSEQNLRSITVTINYRVGKLNRTYTLVSYVSAFA